MKNIKAIIFDLDGTLLNTINDITKALNYALSKNGYDVVTVDEAKYLVGNGAKMLIERALKKVCHDEDKLKDFDNVYNDYMYSYNLWKYNTTVPYQSVVKTIHILRRKGLKLCVLSNKPDRDTKELVNKFFPSEFDIVCGSVEGVPLKPNPSAVNRIIAELNLNNNEVAYVGDSDVDIITGKNASLFTVGACYGFRNKRELTLCGADCTINSFYDLLKLFTIEPNGILLVDKAKGISSQECITKIKKIIGSNKIGHAGTLDPLATGLLVVLLGDATKLSNYLLEDNKKYIGEVTIGKTTNTLDLEGVVTETKPCKRDDITLAQVDEVLKSLIGPIKMEVPMHSAIKVNGKKLYELARDNKEIEVPIKDNYIYDLQRISDLIYENDTVRFTFSCHVSKGTYIRKLCEMIGKRLNYPAYMNDLRRTGSGSLSINQARTIDDIQKGNYKIISVIEAIKNQKIVEVNDYLYNRVINGMPIRIYDCDDENIFIAHKNEKNEKNLIAIYEKVKENDYKARRIWK